MADRYWVGGTNTWNTTAGAKWSTTSGGAGGASVPTLNDDVYFDQNSNVGTGAFTVTLSGTVNCRNITVQNLDGAMTINGSGSLNVYGNLTFPSTGLTFPFSGSLNILSENSILNTGGVTISAITFIGKSVVIGDPTPITQTVTLASSLNIVNDLFIRCNFNSQGYSITANSPLTLSNANINIDISNTNIIVNALILENSLTTDKSKYLPSVINSFNSLNSNLTLINTSKFALMSTRNGESFDLSTINPAFNTVTLINNTITSNTNVSTAGPINWFTIVSSFTTNNFIIHEPASERLYVQIQKPVIVNNEISIQPGSSTSSTKRVIMYGAFIDEDGIQKNLGGTSFSAINTDFYGIGTTASTVACVRCGDYGFNTGINFDDPRTLYWSGTNSDVWHSPKWSLVSGQTGTELPPLAQDTIILDDTSSASELILDQCATVKNLDASTRTLPLSLTDNSRSNSSYYGILVLEEFIRITGNLTVSENITFNGQCPIKFLGPGLHNIIAEYLPALSIDVHSGIVRMQNDLAIGTQEAFMGVNTFPVDVILEFTSNRSRISLISGEFHSNGYYLTSTIITPKSPFVVRLPNIENLYAYYINVDRKLNIGNSVVTVSKINNENTYVYSSLRGIYFHKMFNILSDNSTIKVSNTLMSSEVFTLHTFSTVLSEFSRINSPLNNVEITGINVNIAASSINNIYSNTLSNKNITLRGIYNGQGFLSSYTEPVKINEWGLSSSPDSLISIGNNVNSITGAYIEKVGGGIVEADYLSISNSTATPPNTWYAGPNSINVLNNIGWIFANPDNPAVSGDFFLFLED